MKKKMRLKFRLRKEGERVTTKVKGWQKQERSHTEINHFMKQKTSNEKKQPTTHRTNRRYIILSHNRFKNVHSYYSIRVNRP